MVLALTCILALIVVVLVLLAMNYGSRKDLEDAKALQAELLERLQKAEARAKLAEIQAATVKDSLQVAGQSDADLAAELNSALEPK